LKAQRALAPGSSPFSLSVSSSTTTTHMSTIRLLLSAAVAAASSPRPHVVIIIVDDVGSNDVGWKNPLMQTPFLNSLHNQSTNLERFYAYPTCSPSRGALFTGRYAHETGLTFALIGRAVGGVDLSLPTVAHAFADRGYSTELIGKWHIGHAKHAHLPTARGFDRFFGLKGGAFHHLSKIGPGGKTDLFNSTSNGSIMHVTDPDLLDPTYHATEMFTDAAVHSIKAHDSTKPMFLTLSYSAPHDPLLVDPKKGDEYMESCSGFSVLRRQQFCAMLSQVDDGVERVVESLQARGMWENTALFFLSDNGGMPYGGGNNAPLRGMKSSMWEGGVRVPGFLRLPSNLDLGMPSGSAVHAFKEPFHITDVAPTLLAISDSASFSETHEKHVKDPVFDGRNMLPAIFGEDINADVNADEGTGMMLHHDPYTNGTAYLKGRYKLMLGSPGVPWVYGEPKSSLFMPLDHSEQNYVRSTPFLTGSVMEVLSDLADMVVEGAGAPFTLASYVIAMNRGVAMDRVSGTHYRNLLVAAERDFPAMSVQTRDSCPTLELNNTQQHVFLFDVVQDPSEAHNLASEQHERVRAMHQELCDLLRRSNGVIVAGDAEDSAITPSEALYPGAWLADDTDISTLSSVKGRFFVELSVKMEKLAKLIGLIGLLIGGMSIMSLLSWQRKRSNNKKNKRS